jgi:branched-chain amino acid transport system permease protein
MSRTRILTGLVLAPTAVAGLLWLPTEWLALVAAVLLLAGLWEWTRLTGLSDPMPRLGYITANALMIAALAWAAGPNLFALKAAALLGVAWWVLALAAGFLAAAIAGLLMQVLILRHMQGQDLRQTMVTIGLSIVIADLLLWAFTAQVHQMEAPEWLQGPIRNIPLIKAYSAYRLSLLVAGVAIGVFLWWLLTRTTVGAMIRAGVDDRQMLAASGVNVNLVFAVTFMLGAGLAGLGGVIGAVELSMVPGEDTRLLLASRIVVIVGGMGSVVGAALGAVILGLAETYGLAYAPTYSVVFTFVILILVLAFRPRGILGKPA